MHTNRHLIAAGVAAGLCLLAVAAVAQEAAGVEAAPLATPATPTAAPPAAVAVHTQPDATWWPAGLSANVEDRVVGRREPSVQVGRPLATDDARLDGEDLSEHRLRVGAQWKYPLQRWGVADLRVAAQADLFAQTFDAAGTASDSRLRQAWLEATTAVGRFGAGRTMSAWGLGIVAQPGLADPLQFGLERGGSLVDRVQAALLPAALWTKDPRKAFPLALVLAADRVARDGLADMDAGDQAYNAVAALLYRTTELELGVYGVVRTQTDAQGLDLNANIADLYGAWSTGKGAWKLKVSGEGAFVWGTTTWLRTASYPQHMDLQQYGGALRLDVSRRWLQARLETGMASGDGRPLDGTLGTFRFAEDYRVGLVLFPHYLRRQTQATAQNLTDPRFAAQPPAGVAHVESEGAVTQAIYVNPVVRLQPHPRVAILVGGVMASAPTVVADPFQTFLTGGKPIGPRGAAAARALGLEFDGGVEGNLPLGAGFAVVARVQGGWLLPGEAFADASGASADSVGVAEGSVALSGQW
ncbi:MAG: hypothetical protein ACOYOB_11080 [Myxococcota bacterium]